MANEFEYCTVASELGVREAVSRAIEHLKTLGLQEEQAGNVEIALSEAANNVVEHAYAGMLPGEVCITGRLLQGILSIEIRDEGAPLPSGKLPEGKPADLSCAFEDLPEGGFGWFLIRSLTETVDYDRIEGVNTLSLRFNLA
ncbi:MAG: ATP-binding protein [Rhodobacteraceae bacterium]|nr:ATP-binding protein [Paracoccaceae bacterium]